MGPMGKQGRENIPGDVHIRKKGWRGQWANQGGRPGVHLHMQQSMLGESLLSHLEQGDFSNLGSVPPRNHHGPFLFRATGLHNVRHRRLLTDFILIICKVFSLCVFCVMLSLPSLFSVLLRSCICLSAFGLSSSSWILLPFCVTKSIFIIFPGYLFHRCYVCS